MASSGIAGLYGSSIFSFFLLFIYLFIYLFMAVLGLRFCARAFSSCGKWGPHFIVVRGPLTIVDSLVAEHRLQTRRLSSCGSWAQLLHGMWDLPRPGLEPLSPALAGGFSTTAPPGKPGMIVLGPRFQRSLAIPAVYIIWLPSKLYCFKTVARIYLKSWNPIKILKVHTVQLVNMLKKLDPLTCSFPQFGFCDRIPMVLSNMFLCSL